VRSIPLPHLGGLLVAAAALLVSCSDSTKPLENRPPRIRRIVVFPESVVLGGETRVTGLASDEDGDPITYAWSTPAGTLSSLDAPSTFWTAPDSSGAFRVFLTVSDGELSVADSVQILVGEGSIYVTSDPPGANLTIDGESETHPSPHLFPRVAIGPHRIEITSNEFKYDREFLDVTTAHGAADTVGFTVAQSKWRILDLGRDDFEEIGGLTYLRSGAGIVFAARSTELGLGIYSSAITPATGQASGIQITTNVRLNEPIAVAGDDEFLIFTAENGTLTSAAINDAEADGVIDFLGTSEPIRSTGYGAAIRFPDRIAYSLAPSTDPDERPLFWGELQNGELISTFQATSTFGRRPSWDPGSSRIAYQLDGRILMGFVDTGGPYSPDTLATEGFGQMPAWSPWGPRHIAYVQGENEVDAFEVRLQVPFSTFSTTVFSGLFDPRGMAWSPAQAVLAVSQNPGRGQILLLFDMPIP